MKTSLRKTPGTQAILFLLFLLLFTLPAAAETPHYLSLAYEHPLPFIVYFPAGIDADDRLPVLYLLHGQSQSEMLWEDMRILPKLNSLLASGDIEPMIVVCPRESRYLEDMSKSLFPGQLMDELLPLIESVFPVDTRRGARAIGGISRGALWAEMLAYRNYDMFGILGLHSLPDPFFSYPTTYRFWQDNIDLPFMKIRMDIGISDPYVSGAFEFSEQLTTMRFPHIFILDEGNHDITYWEKHLSEYLTWYSAQFSENRSAALP